MTELAPLQTIAVYADYAEAQRAVDKLADSDFPVANVRIVGHGLKSLEVVTGRMTKGRAAGLGAASGAWLGLFIALLMGLFVPAAGWFGLVVSGLLLGALFGAVLGFFGHWATGGQRDFTSERTMVATSYEVQVPADLLLRARSVLGIAG